MNDEKRKLVKYLYRRINYVDKKIEKLLFEKYEYQMELEKLRGSK